MHIEMDESIVPSLEGLGWIAIWGYGHLFCQFGLDVDELFN
jgi:hypothetical protein